MRVVSSDWLTPREKGMTSYRVTDLVSGLPATVPFVGPEAQERAQGAVEALAKSIELDVLDDANGAIYWERSERHDTVLDISLARPGLDALGRVLESWIRHFLAVEVSIQPQDQIRDESWVWHIGLGVEGSAILNDLYDGNELGEDRLRRLLTLFRLTFRDAAEMRADIAGRPVYLAMAMDGDNVVRLKPQNLLVNLPIATSA